MIHVELSGGETGGAQRGEHLHDDGQGDHKHAEKGERTAEAVLAGAKRGQQAAGEQQDAGDEDQREAAAHFLGKGNGGGGGHL